ncbi:MAG: choice-of-anchor Q domain-containing protein [Solirubrobacterales bacterium]
MCAGGARCDAGRKDPCSALRPSAASQSRPAILPNTRRSRGSFSSGDPQLGGLADNGGPTQTMALGPGSAAIDQVPVGTPNRPGADQRGTGRPQGAACDIGAFEVVVPPGALAAAPAGAVASATSTTKKCKKGRNLKKGKCVKKKRKKK